MRPVFMTTLEPLAPMAEKKCATYGCSPTIFATFTWCSIMPSNEMSWAVSVNANTWPVSSLGMKPLGMITKR